MTCVHCGDTGWVSLTRPSKHDAARAVSVARPCWCRATNDAYRQQQARLTRGRQTPVRRRRKAAQP